MELDRDACHAAVRTRDSRFDGTFYTAVKTTGVYCRPVCPAKTPRAENCTFYGTPAEAEAAGYRPCLRCRPELSPSPRPLNGSASLVRQFIAFVNDDGLFSESLEAVAERLGVSSRHLRRAVEQECGVSPIDIVRTARLLFARRLLSTTALPVSSIAFSSGFGSIARFNHAFRAQYGTTPTDFRLRSSARLAADGAVRLTLAFRPPFAWQTLLDYLAPRCIPAVETVRDGRYLRTLRVANRCGWVSARLTGNGVEVEVSDALATLLMPVAGRVRRMFDLDGNSDAIDAVLRTDPRLESLVDATPGLRVPGSCENFELAVRIILGQQITVRGATTLAGRLVERFAEPASGTPEGLSRWPLRPAALAAASIDEIASCGIPRARAVTIRGLASAVAEGRIDLDRTGPSSATLDALKQIPGIGPWTLAYLGMRVLRWPDAFPATDLGLRKAYPGSLESASENWRPWRAYAAMHLWNSLSKDNVR